MGQIVNSNLATNSHRIYDRIESRVKKYLGMLGSPRPIQVGRIELETIIETEILAGRYPRIDDLAAFLKTSKHSLKCHLQREGTSYKELVGTVRIQLSNYFLMHTDLNMFQIARNLGYSSRSGFSRFYEKQTGISPSAMRHIYRHKRHEGHGSAIDCNSITSKIRLAPRNHG